MAVDAIVSFAIGKLGYLLKEEVAFLGGVKDQVEGIKTELRRMQCFLKDAEEKQGGDARVKNWVMEIRDVAFEAEDVIDTYILDKELERRKKTSIICSFIRGLIARHKVGQEINCINAKIRGIKESRQTYGIENISIVMNESLRERRRPSPHSTEPDIVGIEEDVKKLEARMIKDGDTQRRVISVVGMGGLGKTTLAKRVYNSSIVTSCFQCRAWVYVSQVYSTKELLQDIWKNVMGYAGDNLTVEQMKEKLSDFLKERRYLIVMDDVWTTQLWESIEAAFPTTTNGSRILLTTRNKDVAAHADSKSPPHEPQLLSDENSWSLFLKKVGIAENDCPPNLEEVGKQIVKRCRGLPLALVVLGGLLSRRASTYAVWSRLLDRVSWQLKEDPKTQFSEILALSYNDLPSYLKPCFIFFGAFPEDYEICIRRLIGLWLAEGLVQQRENESPEDVAEDYLEELIDRSIIQVAAWRSDGKVKTCRMHDLIRDLSLSKAQEANFVHVNQSGDSTSTTEVNIRRHASHHHVNNLPSSVKRLRSLLIFNSRGINGEIVKEFLHISTQNKGLRLLRVLDLEGVFMPQLPEALGDLIHLRYLGLRNTTSCNLPSSLGNLRNLQTLDLKKSKIMAYQAAIWPLQQLRHLYLNAQMSGPIANLSASGNCSSLNFSSLQTLWGIVIDKESYVKDGLENSTNLKKLKILGDLVSQEESLVKWLGKMDRLEVLWLQPSHGVYPYILPRLNSFASNKHLYRLHISGRFSERLLELHQFPPNLTMLTLSECSLEMDPMPTLEKLKNLEKLTLASDCYIGKEMVCCIGFLRLQDLKITALQKLERWTIEGGAMRSLRKLELHYCNQLGMIPEGLHQITSLQILKLRNMPDTFVARVQANKGEDWCRIKHIPSIEISEW